MEKSTLVCVTGAAGYIGSWLVKKLLEKGYTVHATLRNLEDASKVRLLRSLPYASTRLLLFGADIYNDNDFEPVIRGCEFVFHVANPMLHDVHSTKYKNTWEAAVAGVKSILESSMRSGTVKRLIYTASVMAASPLKEDSTGFKDSIDESCWTTLNLSIPHCSNFEMAYINSKTLSEKEALMYGDREDAGFQVVTLACGLVAGDTILPYMPASIQVTLSALTGNINNVRQLQLLQALAGSVPIIHIDDVCEAHVFCMEQSSMSGRFLCASSYPTIDEIVRYYRDKYKEFFSSVEEILKEPEKVVACGSTKLIDMGFEYKYDMKRILDNSVECAKKLGVLK